MSIESQYKELFDKGDYKGAINLLRQNKDQFDPAPYHYNLGINYARAEQYPLARLHLEKARDEGLYSPEARESLAKVKELTGADRMEEKSSFSDYVYNAALDSSLYTAVNITLVLLIVLLTQLKKLQRLWSKIVLAVLTLLPLLGQLYIKSNYTRAIAMDSKPVLMGPSAIFEQSQELVPGMRAILSEDFNGWRYIVSPASHKGWTRSENLKDF